MSSKKQIFDVLQTDNSMSFVFSSTLRNIDNVCEQTTHYLRSRIKGIEKQLFPINLVIREGLTNAVRHGNAGDPEKIVRFVLSITETEMLKLMIEDQGGGFDWRRQQAAGFPEDADHGRGITIMDTYFSHYFYNDKGNILYLEKDIST